MKNTENFNGIIATANDERGEQFLSSMARIRDAHDNAEKRFEEFCLKENIGGWHITDGWWQSDKLIKRKDGYFTSFGCENINLTWLQSHNKGKRNPKEGQLLANFYHCVPPTDKPFIVHLYRVIKCTSDLLSYPRRYNLLLEETKWCRYDNVRFEFFVPTNQFKRKTLFDKIKDIVNYFT